MVSYKRERLITKDYNNETVRCYKDFAGAV